MSKKNKVYNIRIGEEEYKIIKFLTKDKNLKLASLIREYIKDLYHQYTEESSIDQMLYIDRPHDKD